MSCLMVTGTDANSEDAANWYCKTQNLINVVVIVSGARHQYNFE